MERINPFSDFGFKLIFGQESSKSVLISLLNSLFEGEREIVDLTYLNLEQLPDTTDGRRSIYDVYCTTTDGERIIVEMQYKSQDNFKERSLYYPRKPWPSKGGGARTGSLSWMRCMACSIFGQAAPGVSGNAPIYQKRKRMYHLCRLLDV